MYATDELLTIAEVAIALAGFAGVVVAFSQQGQLLRVDQWRFVGVLFSAVAAAILAFVPYLLQSIDVSGPSVWRWSSATFLVTAVSFFLFFLQRMPRVARVEGAAPPTAVLVIVLALSLLNILLQSANAIGWPWEPASVSFVAGLLLWLVVAALGFGLLVLRRPEQ